MKLLRSASAVTAGALLAVGLVALPADSSPAAAGDGAAALRAALPDSVPGLSGGLLHDSALGRDTGHRVVPAQKAPAPGRVTVYVEGDSLTALSRAVAASGGTVTGQMAGVVRADVPKAALRDLAGAQGVRAVRPPDRAEAAAVTSEGVGASGAGAWQSVGTGAGVKIGIVDVGFAGLATAQSAGELPATGAGLTVTAMNRCVDTNTTDHGTAVSEIVNDMAPQAQLFLVCITDSIDLNQAADFLLSQGVSVVNMSLTFPFSGRGDGTGDVGGVIQRSRRAGLLWSVAAGNENQDHFRGRATDHNGDGFVEFSGTDAFNSFAVGPGGSYDVGVQWDAWPTTTTELDIVLMAARHAPTGPDDPDLIDFITFDQSVSGPFDPVAFSSYINDTGSSVRVWPMVLNFNAPQTVTYDLTVLGEVGPLQYSNAGSIGEPATSPYAMAVGAVCAGSGGLEPFSSSGPTIDGRAKPDIAAFDGVSTLTFGGATAGTCDSGFLGTSAATPHVTGAAALVKSANPALDAAQIQNYLETHAAGPATPNLTGHGVLNMGPQEVPQARQGGMYAPLATPQRVLDTRTSTGGHLGRLGAGEIFTLSIPGLPADASAVAINLTGTAPTVATHLDIFPEVFTGTSTLNLVANQTAAVFTMVGLGPNHTIKVRNAAGETHAVVDLLGSFGPSGGATYVPKNPPARLLDTRTATGGHQAKLAAGETFALQVRGVAGIPADATAVMVNVTGVDQTVSTHLQVFPEALTSSSTLNLDGGKGPRANVTAVGIGSDGKIRVRNTSGTVNVIVDLQGWFVPSGGARFVAVNPTSRILDTRTGNGLRFGPLPPNGAMTLQGSMIYGVPYNATTVVFNLTAVQPTQQTFVIAWPSGLPRPGTSNINVGAGQVVPNAAVVGVGTNGTVSLFNVAGNLHLVADLTGYFA